MSWITWAILGAAIITVIAGIRIVRPTHRLLIETFGKYTRFGRAGFNWVIPGIQQVVYVDITENMTDVGSQGMITKDNLLTKIDAQVYYKVRDDEKGVMASQYNVANYRKQIVNLAQTTLRNIVGTMTLKDANSKRNAINKDLLEALKIETRNWGIDILRTEIKEIEPPQAVLEVMNEVVIAENKKVAALDFATAAETEADGKRRAAIKEADGKKQAAILRAEGEAKAIELVNKALRETFKGEAQLFKKLEVAQNSLQAGTKYVIDSKSNLVTVLSEIAGVPIPIPPRKGVKQ